MWFPYVNSNSREKCIEYIFHDCFQNSREKCIGSPNPLFYRCKFFALHKTIHFFKQLERNSPQLWYWRLLTSPIVEKKHVVSLCKFKQSWKMYWIHISRLFSKKQWKMYWIAKPFVLPLQIFFITKNNTLFQKTRTKLAATVAYWRLLTSPIVEKNMCIFLM